MSLRAVILGGGGIAEAHLSALRDVDGIEAVAVAELNEQRGEVLRTGYGVKVYSDYRAMIDEERPDIAVIALPHAMHLDASLYASSRGCHLLIEKPMAVTAEQCTAIEAAVYASGVRVLIGHTQQYLAEPLRARELIRSVDIGRPVMIREAWYGHYFTTERPAWFLNKQIAGGGIFANIGVHSIDKIQWLTDSRIIRVRAALNFDTGIPDIEGGGLVYAETSAGIPASISLFGYPGEAREVTELMYTNGKIRIDNHKAVWLSQGGSYEEISVGPKINPFVLQFRDLLAYIRDGRKPYATVDYGKSVIEVLEAIYRSHQTGQYEQVHQIR